MPTINFRVDYVRPSIGSSLLAKATVRRVGRTVGVVDIDVYDDQDRLTGRRARGLSRPTRLRSVSMISNLGEVASRDIPGDHPWLIEVPRRRRRRGMITYAQLHAQADALGRRSAAAWLPSGASDRPAGHQ